MGDRKLRLLCFRSTAFHSSICTYYWCQKCFHGSVYAWHVVIAKGFCYSRSPNLFPNLLLRKRPTYIHWLKVIDFPDLVINCAYRFKYFFPPSLAVVLGSFLCLYPILNWNAGVPLLPKRLSRLKGRVQAPILRAFHHLLIGPSAGETGLHSHEQPASLGCTAPNALGGPVVTPVFST